MNAKKLALFLLALISLNSAKAFDKAHVLKATYNGQNLSVQSSSSWKFTVNYTTDDSSCTGFFITSTKMLTAAHCFETSRNIRYLLFFKGSEYTHYLDLDYQNVTAKVRTHSHRDVAVVDFSESPAYAAGFYDASRVTTVSSRHLNYFSELRGRTLFVTGAGINNKNKSDYLGFIKGRYSSDWGGKIRFSSGRQGICGGDSGSPVMISDARDGLVAVGIAVSTYRNINKDCGNDSYFEALDGDLSDWIWK
jgi:V8-like Glu-specific endopeptidase